MQELPIYSGHNGYGSTLLQLLELTRSQVEAVVKFRTQPRDFSAPRMELASSVPTVPLAEMGRNIDVTA